MSAPTRVTVVLPWEARERQAWAGWVEQSEVAGTVRRAADGDRAAWNALVESFSGMIWSVSTSYRLGPADAAEVVQTTWLRLLENLGRIREPERVGGWLATTARRESLRLLRLRGRELVTDDETRFDRGWAGPGNVEVDRTPEDVLLDRDRDRALWRAFARLSERCRQLLQLVVVDAPPYAVVSAALDMPVGSIGPTRARCLDQLRRFMAADDSTDVPAGR